MKYLIALLFCTSVLAKTHIVEMRKKSFVPANITIQAGDEIKFVNVSKMIHNVVIKKLKIRTKYVKKGKSVTIKIDKSGEFDYYCQPHRTMGMVGTITSKE